MWQERTTDTPEGGTGPAPWQMAPILLRKWQHNGGSSKTESGCSSVETFTRNHVFWKRALSPPMGSNPQPHVLIQGMVWPYVVARGRSCGARLPPRNVLLQMPVGSAGLVMFAEDSVSDFLVSAGCNFKPMRKCCSKGSIFCFFWFLFSKWNCLFCVHLFIFWFIL